MHLLACARALVWRHKTRVNGASARVSRLHKGAKVEHEGALKGKMLGAAAMGGLKNWDAFFAQSFAARRHGQHFLFSAPSFNGEIFYSPFFKFLFSDL
jgi:hypothetical protein